MSLTSSIKCAKWAKGAFLPLHKTMFVFSRSFLTTFSNETYLFLIFYCPPKPTISFFFSLPLRLITFLHYLFDSKLQFTQDIPSIPPRICHIFTRDCPIFIDTFFASSSFRDPKHSFLAFLANFCLYSFKRFNHYTSCFFYVKLRANWHRVSLHEPFLIFPTNIHWFSRIFNWYGEE